MVKTLIEAQPSTHLLRQNTMTANVAENSQNPRSQFILAQLATEKDQLPAAVKLDIFRAACTASVSNGRIIFERFARGNTEQQDRPHYELDLSKNPISCRGAEVVLLRVDVGPCLTLYNKAQEVVATCGGVVAAPVFEALANNLGRFYDYGGVISHGRYLRCFDFQGKRQPDFRC